MRCDKISDKLVALQNYIRWHPVPPTFSSKERKNWARTNLCIITNIKERLLLGLLRTISNYTNAFFVVLIRAAALPSRYISLFSFSKAFPLEITGPSVKQDSLTYSWVSFNLHIRRFYALFEEFFHTEVLSLPCKTIKTSRTVLFQRFILFIFSRCLQFS